MSVKTGVRVWKGRESSLQEFDVKDKCLTGMVCRTLAKHLSLQNVLLIQDFSQTMDSGLCQIIYVKLNFHPES